MPTTVPGANEPDEAELTRQLAELAKASEGAEGFLGSLVAALFPEGMPGRDQLTWPEKAAHTEAARPQTPEERVRAAEIRFRTLVEQIPAVTFLAVLGDGKNEIYVSPHIEQMLGFSQQEWLEAPFLWYWQLHPDDRQVWNDEFTRGCQTGGPFKAECRFIARDGHIVWVRGEARLVKDEIGRPMLLQGIAFDITESKRAHEVLLKEATRSAREAQELAIAHRVQMSILPRDLKVPGLEIAATMIPADEVGGDYYDLQPFEGGAWLAIGDVSGHGLDSGLVMMMVQSALAAIVRARPDITPKEALTHANALMFENIRGRLGHDDHITLTLMRYREDGQITFAGAHEDILVARADGTVDAIRTPGTWLGGMKTVATATVDTQLQLNPGDVMVLYTDGVTEAMNADGELFELDRLCDCVRGARHLPADGMRDVVLSAVRGWMVKQHDDLTVMVVRYTGEGQKRALSPASATVGSPSPLQRASLLDAGGWAAVPELVVAGAANRLSSSAGANEHLLTLRLIGVAESPDVTGLSATLTCAHELALERGWKTVELDLRSLKFMGSSSFKQLVTWLARIAALEPAARYHVRFVGDEAVRWQRTGSAALAAFAPGIVAQS